MAAQQPPGINFRYDVLPRITLDLVASKVIDPAAVVVLQAIMRFWRQSAHSCWMPNGKIEKLTGFSKATIKRHVRALTVAGLVERVKVAKPDPQHPENFTGYRFSLLFTPPNHGVTGDPTQGSRATPPRGHERSPSISSNQAKRPANAARGYSAGAGIDPDGSSARLAVGARLPSRGSRRKNTDRWRAAEQDQAILEEAEHAGSPRSKVFSISGNGEIV